MANAPGIIQVDDVLLVPLHEDVDDVDITELQDALSEEIVAKGARGVVIDVSSLDIVDTFVGRVLEQLAKIAQILNAQTFLVGMQPAVAMTLVELGLDLPDVRTALSLSHAMRRLNGKR